MNRKHILILIFISLFLYIPYVVKAEDISYGDCITNYGSIRLIETGDDNESGGKISANIIEENDNNNTMIIEVTANAGSGDKVTNVSYKITDSDGNTCDGKVTGSSLENNEGSVKLNFVIDKNAVDKITFGLTDTEKQRDKIYTVRVSGYSIPDLTATSPIECDDDMRETIQKYWKYISLLAPILLIVMATFDFLKATASGDSDAIKKSSSAALRRAIATIIIIYLPVLLRIVFTWFGLENALCF